MSLGLGSRILEVDGLQLRPLAAADAQSLFALFSDPDVTEYMDIDPLTQVAEARDIIAWAQDLAAVDQGGRWGIWRPGKGLIGTCGFNSLELSRGRRGEVAYDLARAEWGKGIMSRLLPVILDLGYRELGLRRIEAMVTVGNQRSCKLLERHGFTREGELRDHGYWKGRFWDQIVYGRLSD